VFFEDGREPFELLPGIGGPGGIGGRVEDDCARLFTDRFFEQGRGYLEAAFLACI